MKHIMNIEEEHCHHCNSVKFKIFFLINTGLGLSMWDSVSVGQTVSQADKCNILLFKKLMRTVKLYFLQIWIYFMLS